MFLQSYSLDFFHRRLNQNSKLVLEYRGIRVKNLVLWSLHQILDCQKIEIMQLHLIHFHIWTHISQ